MQQLEIFTCLDSNDDPLIIIYHVAWGTLVWYAYPNVLSSGVFRIKNNWLNTLTLSEITPFHTLQFNEYESEYGSTEAIQIFWNSQAVWEALNTRFHEIVTWY